MTDEQRCEEIVREIVRRCNDEQPITFTDDWGGNSLTIEAPDLGHTHVGDPGATFSQLVKSLHDQLCKRRGLSWVKTDKAQPNSDTGAT